MFMPEEKETYNVTGKPNLRKGMLQYHHLRQSEAQLKGYRSDIVLMIHNLWASTSVFIDFHITTDCYVSTELATKTKKNYALQFVQFQSFYATTATHTGLNKRAFAFP